MKPIDTHREPFSDYATRMTQPDSGVIHIQNKNRPVDSVAIVSGGMDSVTMLYLLVEQGNHPLVLSFDYGQKHVKELEFADFHADRLGLRHKVVDLSSVASLLTNSALVGPADVPEGHYADDVMKQTVVPNRNSMMINIATAAAINLGAKLVGIGVHAGDHPIYPDCRPSFIHSLHATLMIANEGFVRPDFNIFAPFCMIGKEQIVSIGDDLNVPFQKTWSCYKGGELHCGKCGTCVERREAFDLAGVNDPTTYVA
jgi:7-cyano-7-deazaguanine synthase